MTDVVDAFRAVAALAFGGLLFITIGGTLSSSASASALVDLQFWGVLYLIAAIVLAVGVVYTAVQAALS